MPELSPVETEPEKRIIIDQERVDLVLGRLVTAYTAGEYPYSLDSARLPQDLRHLPESLEIGSEHHANFLWNSCYYMRGGIKSVEAFRRLSKVYDQAPELFDMDTARQTPAESIARVLGAHGLGFQKTVSRAWVTNAERMHQKWDDNPVRIFDGVSDYDTAVSRIKNHRGEGFIGFQEKMVSMITYYLMDEGFIDEFQFPLPVDLHVMRVTIANEMVRFPGYQEDENLFTEETLATIRQLYHDYAVNNNVSTLRLCDAVWLLSESLCGMQPGNITIEPEGRNNRNGRRTVLLPFEIQPNSQAQRERYQRACGSCPVEQTCEWNLPGKPYYVAGVLARRGRRVRFGPPESQPSLLDEL